MARFSIAQALLWLSLAAVLAGVVFRFSDLDVKTFWGDETYTLLRVSGYAQRDLDRLSDGVPRGVDEVRFFQRVHGNRSIRDTINSLAVDEPQHPPLYFVAERLWINIFGDSLSAVRSLSAIAGTGALLGMFWLAAELFPGSNARFLAVALAAVSPFQVVYSHEAREYSAWSAITIIATAALLAAIRRRHLGWWVLYASTVAVGCYTDLIFVYVVAAHALTVLLLRPKLKLRTLSSFVAATAAGIVAFAPWLVTFYQHRAVLSDDIGWAAYPMPLPMYVAKLGFNAAAVFFDLGFLSTRYAVLTALVLCVVMAALLCVARFAPLIVKAIVFPLVTTTSIVFIAGDLVHHSYYATAARYLVPVWIGFEIAVTYACVLYADRISTPERWRVAWRSTYVALIVLGCVSNAIGVRQTIWWDNHDDVLAEPTAAAINSVASPLLLLRHDDMPRLLVLSRYLRDDARIEIVTPAIRSSGIDHVPGLFVLSPDEKVRRAVAAATGCPLAPVEIASRPASAADAFHAALYAHRKLEYPGGLWAPRCHAR